MQYHQPVLFIDIIKQNDIYQFKLTEIGEEILLNLSDKIISVIGIAGP